MSTELALPVPTAGLIASLSGRAWMDTARNGMDVYCALLITHPPRRSAPDEIAWRMRGVATALGLVPPGDRIPDVGERLMVRPDGDLRLRFDGTDYTLRLPLGSHYGATMLAQKNVLLAVGLDPLDHGASVPEADQYINTVTRAGRMFFGNARMIT